MTFGLSSYRSGDPEDEGIDERERRIRRSLQSHALRSSTWNLDGDSLITDGKWGEYTILFPFSVYEEKKNEKSEVAVQIQLKLALNAYLKMIDRLVRQSGSSNKYQSSQSTGFPVSGFTSNASIWRIYVGYLPICVKKDASAAGDPLCDGNSQMKSIWKGNVFEREDAGELLDMGFLDFLQHAFRDN
ncbi:hypothetical protein BDV10DRAFT_188141 [Aspergillus recurvatus]